MPSFNFYATFDESLDIVRDFCAQGLSIIPYSGLYDEAAAPRFESVSDELLRHFRTGPVFYIAGPFTHSPICFRQLKNGANAGKYRIDESSDGPLLQASIARVNVVDGKPRLL